MMPNYQVPIIKKSQAKNRRWSKIVVGQKTIRMPIFRPTYINLKDKPVHGA